MSENNLPLTVGLSLLGIAALGGLGFGAYVLAKREGVLPAGTWPNATPGNGVPVNTNVNAQIGPNAGWDDVRREQEQYAKREAEWRKRDKINQLERDLSDAQNEIKRLTDKLNTIDNSPLPYDIKADVTQQRVTHCENSREWYNIVWECEQWRHLNGDGGKWQKQADGLHEKQKERERRPLRVRLSELNTLQLNLIQNLSELGVTKRPVRAA